MEARDLLADEVQVGGPVALELRLLGLLLLCGQIVAVLGPVADGGDVVGEGVESDVDHVLRIGRNWDAPVEGGARDGEVLQCTRDVIEIFTELFQQASLMRQLKCFQYFKGLIMRSSQFCVRELKDVLPISTQETKDLIPYSVRPNLQTVMFDQIDELPLEQ